MAIGETFKESDGKAVNVDLTASVSRGNVVYADGWLGIAAEGGESGESIALTVEQIEYQFEVPSTLVVSKGDTVYIDTAQVTGHIPDAAGYATTSGATTLPLFKATADKDANDVVTGIFLGK